MAIFKRIATGIVLAGVIATVIACGVALGLVLATGAAVSRRSAGAIGTVIVGFAAAVALATLRIRAGHRARITA